MTENKGKGRPLFYFRLQRSSRARWIVQGRAPPWFAEKIILARWLRYFFAKPCAIRHGTERQARIKYRLDKPQMSNSKNERYEQKQLHPDGKIP